MFDEKVLGPIANPELIDVLEKQRNIIFSSLNCVQVGTIEAFDLVTCTAKVSVNAKKKLDNGSVYDYPLLTDCPVFVLTAGDAFVNMPPESGDTCIILFNDRSIDNWFLSGEKTEPNSQRMHSLSDGMVLVGIRSLSDPPSFSLGKVGIDAGSKLLELKNSTNTLKTLIDGLIDDLNALTTTNCAPGYPVTLSPTTIAALTARKAQFDLLLG